MPATFDVVVVWDDEASVWAGACDDVPAAADASTIDELMHKLIAMMLDLVPDNYPGLDPATVQLRLA